MRRRFMGIVNAPKLVKLTELGAREYVFEKGYKYADMLVVGGGGKGGMNSGGGGGSGVILYAPNLVIQRFNGMKFSYDIAASQESTSTRSNGYSTFVTFNGATYEIRGGAAGQPHASRGGGGGNVLVAWIQGIGNYMQDSALMNAASCGGGAPGLWTEAIKSGTSGGSGASLFGAGRAAEVAKGGDSVEIQDGCGGYMGGSGYANNSPGCGVKINAKVIPLKSIFGATGVSGAGSKYLTNVNVRGEDAAGAGGGAAGYGSGGSAATVVSGKGGDGGYGAGGGGGHGLSGPGGQGGPGIICIYYHN